MGTELFDILLKVNCKNETVQSSLSTQIQSGENAKKFFCEICQARKLTYAQQKYKDNIRLILTSVKESFQNS